MINQTITYFPNIYIIFVKIINYVKINLYNVTENTSKHRILLFINYFLFFSIIITFINIFFKRKFLRQFDVEKLIEEIHVLQQENEYLHNKLIEYENSTPKVYYIQKDIYGPDNKYDTNLYSDDDIYDYEEY